MTTAKPKAEAKSEKSEKKSLEERVERLEDLARRNGWSFPKD